MSAEAWATYWRERAAAGGACAPDAPGIAAATSRVWREFAGWLPPKAKVLDLATGNGAVLQLIHGSRSDAQLIGVDSAPHLGPVVKGLTLKAQVAMEELPFGAASFDAVTSQFGFEYGRTGNVAAEIARVLRSQGFMRLLIHYAESPIVQQGRARAEQLRWTENAGSPLDVAEKFAATRAGAPMATPPALLSAPQKARDLFPGPSVAAEIATGMLQILQYSGTNAPALLKEMRFKIANELSRLDALAGAARDLAAIEAIVGELNAAGLTMEQPRLISEYPTGSMFAWLLEGRRT